MNLSKAIFVFSFALIPQVLIADTSSELSEIPPPLLDDWFPNIGDFQVWANVGKDGSEGSDILTSDEAALDLRYALQKGLTFHASNDENDGGDNYVEYGLSLPSALMDKVFAGEALELAVTDGQEIRENEGTFWVKNSFSSQCKLQSVGIRGSGFIDYRAFANSDEEWREEKIRELKFEVSGVCVNKSKVTFDISFKNQAYDIESCLSSFYLERMHRHHFTWQNRYLWDEMQLTQSKNARLKAKIERKDAIISSLRKRLKRLNSRSR